jgi:hypothetical protein
VSSAVLLRLELLKKSRIWPIGSRFLLSVLLITSTSGVPPLQVNKCAQNCQRWKNISSWQHHYKDCSNILFRVKGTISVDVTNSLKG